MRSRLMSLAVCSVLMFAPGVTAQQNTSEKPTIVVGIASPSNLSRAVFQADWERDQMVRDVNSESAADKKAAAKIEAVALDGSSIGEVAGQAGDKQCQYIVLTTVSEQIGVAGYDSAAGVPNPMRPAPDTSPAAAKVLGVKYSINRVGEPRVVSHGAVLAEGTGDGYGQSAVDTAFRDAATRIRNDIKRHKSLPVN